MARKARYLGQWRRHTVWIHGKIHGNIPTYCPPHPPSCPDLHGSVLGNELGMTLRRLQRIRVYHISAFSLKEMNVLEWVYEKAGKQ